MRQLSRLLAVLLAFMLAFTPLAEAAQISRQHADTIVNGNLANANDINDELNSLVNESNSQDTRLTSVESGNMTFSGVKTFAVAPIVASLKEAVGGHGVNIAGTRIYNGFANLSSIRGTFESVDISTEVITLTEDHGLSTGAVVKVLADRGSVLDTGLSSTTAYYFRSLASKTGTLHTTSADAGTGTSPVNITAEGSGTRYLIGSPSALRDGDVWVDGQGLRVRSLGATKKALLEGGTFFSLGQTKGLILSNNTTDANNDIDISSGTAISDDETIAITLSGITKQLDAAWSAGTNAGGLDTGSKTNNTWYHVFAISKDDGLEPDALFSLSATTPVMPTDYTKKRLLGSVRTDGSGNIRGFFQRGNKFFYKTQIDELSVATNVAATLAVITVPPDTEAMLNITVRAVSDRGSVLITSPYADDQAPGANDTTGAGIKTLAWRVSAIFASTEKTVLVNDASQIRYRGEGSAGSMSVVVQGWIDPRR